MEQFLDGHHVRLRSRVLGTYLNADKDGEGVSLRRRRASLKAAWAVHLYLGDDGIQYALLHSAAYGRYLAATDDPAPRGCHGFRVAQRDYDQPQAEALRWQAISVGFRDDILLRHVGPDYYRYLRASSVSVDPDHHRYLRPWTYLRPNNSVSIDSFRNVSNMMQWVVEPINFRQGIPRLPRPIRAGLMLRRAEAALQPIRFVLASDQGLFTEDDWSPFEFRGRSVYHLRNELATRLAVGVSDIIMCVRAGRYGRPTPLFVNLPRHGHTIDIVVIIRGTPASAELRHPDVMSTWSGPDVMSTWSGRR